METFYAELPRRERASGVDRLDGRADGGSFAVSDDVASAWFDGKTEGTRTGALSFHGQPEGQRIPGFPAAEFNEGDPMTRILWLTLLLGMMAGMLGCVQNERGYRHLMALLDVRSSISTYEKLKTDGRTCMSIRGSPKIPSDALFCSATRDGAAEITALWIEKNVPSNAVEVAK
jgi:hypothetical protein